MVALKTGSVTGKSFSEAFILASVNPQYDNRFTTSVPENLTSEHVVYKHCFLFWHSKQWLYTTPSECVFFLYRTGKSMNNLS